MSANTYVVGPTPPGTKPTATFETKPGYDSGSGYERWRSVEYRPERNRKEDVYVAHHRLLAVVACYPSDMALSTVLDHLRGRDVHHKSGVEWDNRPGNLAVRDHGRHSEITQAQIRAWAEQDRQAARAVERGETEADTCDGCGESADVLCTSEDFDGERCIECAKQAADGSPIRVG